MLGIVYAVRDFYHQHWMSPADGDRGTSVADGKTVESSSQRIIAVSNQP